MDSILKLFFRQIEDHLHLSHTILRAYQLQNIPIMIDFENNQSCFFSYDLCHGLKFVQKRLHSTCFLLQQALYRIQALRQVRGELLIQVNDDLINKYEKKIAREFASIRQLIQDNTSSSSALQTLETLFNEIQQNFELLLNSMCWSSSQYKNTVFLGCLVSDTLDRFYHILGALARLVMDIDEYK